MPRQFIAGYRMCGIRRGSRVDPENKNARQAAGRSGCHDAHATRRNFTSLAAGRPFDTFA